MEQRESAAAEALHTARLDKLAALRPQVDTLCWMLGLGLAYPNANPNLNLSPNPNSNPKLKPKPVDALCSDTTPLP